MDLQAYNEQMIEYYDFRVDVATLESPAEYAREYDRMLVDEAWYADMVARMRTLLRGRRVLEVAAGGGRWTRHLAPVVDYILATDKVPRFATRCPEIVAAGRDLPPGRVEFAELDGHDPHLAPGEFDAALVVNWFQHIPLQRHREFIDRLHGKLGAGAIVFLAINHLGNEPMSRLFSKPGDPNRYTARRSFDGREFDIIDNVFSEPDLRAIFAPTAKNLHYALGSHFYWLEYAVA